MKFNQFMNPNSIILFNGFRIGVLKKGIIRIEKSDVGFNDYPTQKVMNRYFKKVDFKYFLENDYIVIKMKDYSLYFNSKLEESYILYGENKLALNNDFNLGGTYETVDGMDGDVKTNPYSNNEIKEGICSKNGVAVLDDSESYCFDENLNFSHINKSLLDVYIFFYPNNYKQAVKDFFEISLYPPKLPKYVFGNWWSRFYAYSQEKYLYLMDEFAYNNVPLTIATVDMDWHYSPSNGRNLIKDLGIPEEEFIKNADDPDNKYYCKAWHDSNPWSLGWTGYTWNKKLFKDYEQFLKDLKKRGLHVTLNLHPADGIGWFEEMYERCAKRIGFDTSGKESIPFDLTDEENKKMFFEEILNYYEDKGVDFWWIDWQQGQFSKFPGLTPMWLCNHYFYLDRAKHTNRGLILSRCCGAGGHRYPLGFSGDSFQTFASLKYLVKTTPMATNIGFSYWSHDIGGHMSGVKDGDLYLKFIQFGVFSPILRIHSSCDEVFSKEPWLYLNGYGELINKYLRLRHQMIPYIYSFSLKTNMVGQGLIEPMYYHYPNDSLAYEFSDKQYFFAEDLLVSPYMERKDVNDINQKEVYFPKGTYYDLKYGYEYKGSKVVNIIRETGDMPVFIKKGAFFVLDHNNMGNDISNPKHLDIITSLGYGKYVLYEDNDYDKVLRTTFINKKNEIRIKITGNKSVFIKDRVYSFKILNVYDYSNINVNNCNLMSVNKEGGFLEFTINNVEMGKEVVINYEPLCNKLSNMIRHTTTRLMYVDDKNSIRNELYYKLRDCKNKLEIRSCIKNSKLSNINKEALLEVL